MRLTAARLDKLEDRVSALAGIPLTAEQEATKAACEATHAEGVATMYKWRSGADFILAPHHHVICNTLERVISGEIKRLIINVPPGYSKTEIATIGLIARGLALNPRARFMHLSYSHNLALMNSSQARAVVKSREYQRLWKIKTRDDADSKALWFSSEGGGVYASSSQGQVTGFRAGHMEPGFTGCLNLDDPQKPADAFSETVREAVNTNYNDTIKSRLAIEDVPVIVIMQRIHPRDLTGYLLTGGSGERWHHLCLPVIIDNSKQYPDEYTHGIPIAHGLPDGWLWPLKHNESHREALTSHKNTFYAQYMQEPKRFDAEGALWTESMISQARALSGDAITRCVVGVDPAASSDATSDETGIIVAAKHASGMLSVRGDYSGRFTPDGWAKRAIKAYKDHDADAIVIEVNQGGEMATNTLRASGFTGRIIDVRASKGKFARAEPIAALYEQGKVAHCGDLYQLESQLMEYVPRTSKKSPDRLDAMVWALTELSGRGTQPIYL